MGPRNQSLLAVTHRLTRRLDAERSSDPEKQWFVNIVDLGYRGANIVFVIAATVFGAAFLWLLSRTDYRHPRARAFELGVLLCLVVIASPLARMYYFVWLLFPISMLVQSLFLHESREVRRSIIVSLGAALFCMVLSVNGMPEIFAGYGAMLLCAVIIAAACAREAIRASGKVVPEDGRDAALRLEPAAS